MSQTSPLEPRAPLAYLSVSHLSGNIHMRVDLQSSANSSDPQYMLCPHAASSILDEFQAWLLKEQAQVLPKSPIGQAIAYALRHWQALCRYTEDGILDIDNNLAERLVKLPAILRKNALFVGSEEGGHRAGYHARHDQHRSPRDVNFGRNLRFPAF